MTVPGRIADDAIRTVRERASLIDIVSESVELKRRGNRAVGLCPFHAEKTPSFNVNEDDGFYYCFGCGEGGDVFKFVMKTQGLAFPEAVRLVAQRAGVVLPEPTTDARPRGEPLVAVNDTAAAFFRGTLRGPAGARARAYLAERGIGPDTIERFGVGYAPGGGDALVRHLRAQACPIEDAVTVGLVMRRTGGTFFDRFRDRIMFPIADRRGRVIAFGGRVLPGAEGSGDPPPKYLNSPESPVFHKGRTLYGLGLARDAIRQRGRVIVVEGYLDVIALAQAGIREVVAPLGTALTADQLGLLGRFTERVVACFDGDAAGRRAAARSFPVFIDAGLWGRGVFLPDGEDPDSFVRTYGSDRFLALAETAEPLIEPWLRETLGPDPDAVTRRAGAAREVARLLQRLRTRDPDKFDVLAGRAAQTIGVAEERLRAEGVRGAAPPAPPAIPARAEGAEEILVELLAVHPDVAERLRETNVVAEFESSDWRAAAESLLEEASDDPTVRLGWLPRALRDRAARRLLDPVDATEREQMLSDCVAAIERRRLRRARGQLLADLRAAEARGDVAAATLAQRLLHDSLAHKSRL
jgi:DNA primase